jgi:hypothetical protein
MHLRSYLAIWTINGLVVGSDGSNTGMNMNIAHFKLYKVQTEIWSSAMHSLLE